MFFAFQLGDPMLKGIACVHSRSFLERCINLAASLRFGRNYLLVAVCVLQGEDAAARQPSRGHVSGARRLTGAVVPVSLSGPLGAFAGGYR